jgi:hypothetical protein
MVKLNVKNGTPVGNVHLCRNCNWGHIMTGYRESDLLVMCTSTSPNIIVPFAMLDCSGFDDKYKPTYKQMEKLAIEIKPVRTSPKTPGFSTVTKVRQVQGNDDDQDQDESAQVL